MSSGVSPCMVRCMCSRRSEGPSCSSRSMTDELSHSICKQALASGSGRSEEALRRSFRWMRSSSVLQTTTSIAFHVGTDRSTGDGGLAVTSSVSQRSTRTACSSSHSTTSFAPWTAVAVSNAGASRLPAGPPPVRSWSGTCCWSPAWRRFSVPSTLQRAGRRTGFTHRASWLPHRCYKPRQPMLVSSWY